jgi:hypothetical protein
MFQNERCIIIDESGNLGIDGRYFVIACIDTSDCKALHNLMKRKLKQAKKTFPEFNVYEHEIKAADAYPCVKHHILKSIAAKDIHISYIVADITHIETRLLQNKNILYNYLAKLLIDKIITSHDKNTKINILCDNKTTKVKSTNSFKEYIIAQLNYERRYDLDLNIKFMDSCAGNAYVIQAVDYVANAVYSFFEHKNDLYINQFKNKINVEVFFPVVNFQSKCNSVVTASVYPEK